MRTKHATAAAVLAGLTLAAQAQGPRVVELRPADGSVGVGLSPEIRVRFDRSVDPATLSGDFQPNTTDFTLAWSDADTLMRIVPAEALEPDTTYALAIDNVFDLAGQPLVQPARACFSTGATLACPSFECAPPDATNGSVPPWEQHAYERPFAAQSPWNMPIIGAPRLHPESALMMARFAATFQQFGGLWLGIARHVPPVYLADAATPRHEVVLRAPNAGVPPVLLDVPLPDGALADCGFDRFLGVLDTRDGFFHELHRAQRGADGRWTADTGNATDARAGSGIYPGDGQRSSAGVRASGGSLLAGLVWPHELAAGRIDHALALGYEFIRAGGPVPPFTASDGQVDTPEALPMGARLQLDPALDLDALGLDPWERAVAQALQEYGAYVVDSAGGISLPAVHVLSFEGNPYAGLLPEAALAEEGVLLPHLPPERFRVLAPPAGDASRSGRQ